MPLYMDMFVANRMRTKGSPLKTNDFNIREFIEFSIYMSEGAVRFHKVEHDSDLWRELEVYAQQNFESCLEDTKHMKTYQSEVDKDNV